VFVGFFDIMMRYIRTISDSVRPKFALLLGILSILFGLRPVYAQQHPQPAQDQTPQQTNDRIRQLAALSQAAPRDTPVGAGDLLHIEVFDVPELSRDVRVSDVGDFTFPLIPEKIQSSGLTTFLLEQKLAQLLIQNGLVSHPQVSVFIKEQQSQPVSVVGAVAKPSVFQIVRPTTLLEILTAAGGISDSAGNIVIITRADHPAVGKAESPATADYQPQTITIRLQDLLESGNPAFNIQIYGGDVISVPVGGIVYVTGGGVNQPGGYILQNHGEQITVMKAVALAHGLNGFCKANNAIIMRTNPVTGTKDIVPVRIKDIENQKTEDVKMTSNDILYIPDSLGLKVLARGAEAAVSVGTGVAIYRGGP
jgi:polysaccharide export outer membrane protein